MNQNSLLVKILLILSFVAFSIQALLHIIHHPTSIVLFGISGLISILYVVRIGQWNLREIPFLKVFMVVAAYCILTIGLQIQLEHIPFDFKIISLIFLIFGLTILFDIPDRKIDAQTNKTFAQVLGVRWTILFSAFCVFMYFFLKDFGDGSQGATFNAIWALIIISFYIQLPKKVEDEFYLAFYGEGILGLIGMIPFVCNLIG